MLTHLNFSSWIEVDSTPLQEYGVLVESASRISGWIPADEGKNFTVNWYDHGGKVTTCSFIFLDGGNPIPGQFLHGDGKAWRGGVRTSDRTERPFIFQNVSDAGPSSTVESAESGTIVLKIKRVTLVGEQAPNAIEKVPTVLGNSQAGDVGIGLGMEIAAPRRIQRTFKVVSYENPQVAQPSTYVTFVFRYRTKAFLFSKGMIATEDRESLTAPASGKAQGNKRKRTASSRGDTNPGPLVAGQEQAPAKRARASRGKAGSVPNANAVPDTNRSASTVPSSTVFAPVLPGLPRPSERMQTRWNMGPPPSMAESSSAGQGRFFLSGPVPAVDPTYYPPPSISSFSAMPTVPSGSMAISAQPSFASPMAYTGNDASQHFLPGPVPAVDTTYYPAPTLSSFSAMPTVPGASTFISAQPSFASPTAYTGNDAIQHLLPEPVPAVDTTYYLPPTPSMPTVPRDSTAISAQPSFASPTVYTGNDASQQFLSTPVPQATDGPSDHNMSALLALSMEAFGGNTPLSAEYTPDGGQYFSLPLPPPDEDWSLPMPPPDEDFSQFFHDF